MREYHYIITVQKPNSAGYMSTTRAGIIISSGTRQELFEQIFVDANPERDANVIYFSLEPNKLAA
ncbi:hypothetical protein [Nocardia ignorata]|uniref:Uncharacterized protein n=1 Tax=Nocardia ignorata TaxID=145285 RepID=A0A4R6NYL9_NOCIG|nr:hypothetical protein [Nocardia ignorata]TDP29876.1 hypothetical protein DFR75_112145 [Nocardia ignorata]